MKRCLSVLLVLLSVWLSGCGNEPPLMPPSPTIPIASATIVQPLATATPFTPTEARQWEASPVLAQLYVAPDLLITPEFHWMGVSDVVLYRDGRLIVNRFISNREGERWVLETTQLSQPEICDWLVDMEAIGFFDFQPADYEPISVTDSNTTYFSVRAWREQVLAAYAFSPALDAEDNAEMGGATPTGLVEGYWHLKRLQELPLQPYQPERLQLLLYPFDYEIDESEPWTIETISLAEMMAHYQGDANGGWWSIAEIPTSEVAAVWSLLGERRQATFREGDTIYQVFVRPILPFEERTLENFGAGSEQQYATEPTEPMDCSSLG